MAEGIPPELVSQIRTLTEDVAPRDPEAAAELFDELVRIHGHIRCGIALSYVAPEVLGMLSPAPAHP